MSEIKEHNMTKRNAIWLSNQIIYQIMIENFNEIIYIFSSN